MTFTEYALSRQSNWADIAFDYARQWDGHGTATGGPCGIALRLRACRAAGVPLAYANCDWDRLPLDVAIALAWDAVWDATP